MVEDSWKYVERMATLIIMSYMSGPTEVEWLLLKQTFSPQDSDDEIDIYHGACNDIPRTLDRGDAPYCPACNKEVPESIVTVAELLEVRTKKHGS